MKVLLALVLLVPWAAAAALSIADGRRRWWGVGALAALAASFATTAVLAAAVFADGPVREVVGGWPAGIGITLSADPLGVIFALVSQLVIGAALLHEVLAGVAERRFPALVLFLAAGLNGLFLTGDVFNFYVFFELAMTAGYVICSYRAEEREAGPSLIFAVVNLLGSFVFLIGVAALYHATGTLEMAAVQERIGEVEPTAAIMIAVSFLVAFGVKLGLFPFHFWLPAVYTRAHPAVAAILAGALANIGAYGLLRFGAGLLEAELRLAATALIVIGIASIVYGSLQAIGCRNPAEVLAYSSIGQAGFVLVAIGVGGPVGYAAAVVYAVVNSLNKGLLFLAAGLRGPLVGASFLVGALSVAGVPPAAGFVGKVAVFDSGVELGSVAVVALLVAGSALSFLYMFQIYQLRFWAEPTDGATATSLAPLRALVAALAVIVLAVGLWPEPLVGGSERAAEALIGGTR